MTTKSAKKGATGQRLEPDARRTHLLEIGTTAFAANTYEEVQVDQIAQLAGVSRGLLYHYFPNKRDFFVAIIQQGYTEILDVTRPDPALPPDQQLRASLEAYLGYVEQHPHLYRAIFRSAASADRSIQDIVSRNLDLQAQRILDGREAGQPASVAMRVAARSWLAFLIHAVLDWLDQGNEIGRPQLIEMCVGALEGAIKAALQPSATSGSKHV